MKFSTREDIEAGQDAVFEAFSDFDRFERQALRMGADVERMETLRGPCAGMKWRVRFDYKGRARELSCTLTSYSPNEGLVVDWVMGGLNGTLTIEMIALAPRRTRAKVGLELKPATFSSRLFLQSLRLAKGTLDARFQARVKALADDIRDRDALG